jgi:hypothetical protein
MSAMGELVVRKIIKFFYIFQWKYLARMNGDFAAIYLILLNILFSGVFSFITYFFGFLSAEVNFHICTGKHPQINIDKIFQYQTWSTHNGTGIIKSFEEANIADPVVY